MGTEKRSGKPVRGDGFKKLAEEIRQDEHAARVRDYGEADAATYEQRVREGARMPHLWPSEVAKANRHKPAGQDQDKSTGNQKASGKDGGHSM